jgi:hypothetical protein
VPRRDVCHQIVVQALQADGWTITHDPYPLSYGGRDLYVDLGAEQPIGAEKEGRRIAVEIKSFVGPSDIHEMELAIGQYNVYRDMLSQVEPERQLYLAVPLRTYQGLFSEPLGQLILRRQELPLLVFDEVLTRISQWIP